jgi:hypothetical protein
MEAVTDAYNVDMVMVPSHGLQASHCRAMDGTSVYAHHFAATLKKTRAAV